MGEIFLIDSNSLITPAKQYYKFEIAPKFWEQIASKLAHGDIVILDSVKNELLRGNDELSEWVKNLNIRTYIKHNDIQILRKYSDVLISIKNNKCYKPEALQEWAQASVADPWLVATAATFGYTIVTFETTAGTGLSPNAPSKNPKIPDVAKIFNVKTANLYYMMSALGIRLS